MSLPCVYVFHTLLELYRIKVDNEFETLSHGYPTRGNHIIITPRHRFVTAHENVVHTKFQHVIIKN